METTIQQIEEIVSILTADEQQLLKDTIEYGYYGDASAGFVDDKLGDVTLEDCKVYITNDAKRGGHFSGRQVSAMFRSIYKKLCSAHGNQAGVYVSHCTDCWGDGSGDMLFIRSGYERLFEEWAKI